MSVWAGSRLRRANSHCTRGGADGPGVPQARALGFQRLPALAPDSVLPVKVTAEAARRFLVARHALAPARSLEGGPEAVLEVFRRLGSIQFDPIAVAGRSHDLVLHARVAGYEPAWCDVLYVRREIFEAYNKGLSFVPAREFAWFLGTGLSARETLAENADVAARVLERIRAEGPLSSQDFERESGPTTDWFGAPTNTVRAVLEAYTVTGVLGLARREGNRRYYDLLERLLPAEMLAHEPPLRERLRHKLLSRYRAHGLLGVGGAGDVFSGIGPAKPDPRWPDLPGRNPLREELVERGDIVPVQVEGVSGKRFVVRDEVELLETPPEPTSSVAFLSPFDPLVWDRKLLGALFGFDYVWELFLPPDKRRWGWYVLPIVFRDRFVGRIEPRIDQEKARVQVLDVWWEDGFTPRRAEGFVDSMRDALRAYLRFAGATRLEWAPHLATEKRLFLTRP